MKNILCTGSAGFIASNFVRYVLSHSPSVFITSLDYLSYAGSLLNLQNLPDERRHRFIMGDVCDKKLVKWLLREYEIDTIVHFAAETHVDRSIVSPEDFVRNNITCTFNLLEDAREVWTDTRMEGKRFHYISTDEVYGSLSPEDVPASEITPCRPSSPYSASKAAGDNLASAYWITYGLPITVSHCSNNYGPYQLPEKLIPKMILCGLEGKPMTIHGDGQQIRDWLYVEDHCRALQMILEYGKLGEVYNIGGGNQVTNKQIIWLICLLLDEFRPDGWPHEKLWKSIEDRIGNDRRYCLDTSKIHRELGWVPFWNIEQGIRITVQWYLNNRDWLEAVRKQVGI